MNIDRLLSLTLEEIKEIEGYLQENNEELEFFDRVVSENSFNSIKNLLNINSLDAMTAFLCIDSKEYTYLEIQERLAKNIELIKPGSLGILKMMIGTIEDDKNKDALDIMKEKILKAILDKIEIIDSKSFVELYANNESSFIKILALFSTLERMKEERQEISGIIEEGVSGIGIRVSTKKKNSLLTDSIRDEYNIPKIVEHLSEISDYYQNLKIKDKQTKKELRTKLNNYNEFHRILYKIESKGINHIDINKTLMLIDKEEIQKEFLYQINLVQKDEFNKLNEEYSILSVDNKLEVQAIFKDYDIDFDKLSLLSQNKALVLDKEELKLLLGSIKEYASDQEFFDYLILNSNYSILKHITSLIKTGILTLEFVISNRSLLSEEETDKNNYYKLAEILEFLKKENINPYMFTTYLEIYLTNIDIIKNNIETLKQYNLLSYLKSMESFNLLESLNLKEKIDMLLELGYEKLLEENIGLLNRDINRIKRLYILKNMNLLPIDIDSLVNVLDDPNFLSFTDDLDSYIFNVVDYRIDMSNIELDNNIEFSNSDNNSRIVEINGVILSKNRIKRNMSMLKNSNLREEEKLLYSYVLGSVLSEEEYDKINAHLKTNGKQYSL